LVVGIEFPPKGFWANKELFVLGLIERKNYRTILPGNCVGNGMRHMMTSSFYG